MPLTRLQHHYYSYLWRHLYWLQESRLWGPWLRPWLRESRPQLWNTLISQIIFICCLSGSQCCSTCLFISSANHGQSSMLPFSFKVIAIMPFIPTRPGIAFCSLNLYAQTNTTYATILTNLPSLFTFCAHSTSLPSMFIAYQTILGIPL